ncbi:MAG: bifunctional phosphoribosyl-AMP cyclohydrolase/phosphoribosyl-ATP diphosphatase HisIE [Nitrospinaceae bacterium]|nr:bifunctional phosphoribosyl-AMP cyclohydrolase/phosphoribosyl-ATP diphosphatase HisIE [Nitrospinaceae bacterium]MBT3434364.1 bifunctional phosphoribosyl-AMP cyclohydrolase/phosphoribosyl-ATP diphosphatase HisIE [Nitrospinaceae bacterium]MBT3821229.1 bifunctional phosphoribosyl-AMP cyclohydrolase/phosphoribosyl-ATP diphosphatase HisIE [Nitrospinaceae bacterium]MBT4429696.1 bifunctional phosphoribosyl-AMP cyclohydrolase/phosphoribosyl-ATP diphosphatase HisIE [Nitrospinaceae bacterium]MBT536934
MSDLSLPGIKWNEQGLAAAVCQDVGTGQVLMLAWVNEESLRLTLEKKTVHFWSRSREELWEKGATSGNYLRLVSAALDCDDDALLFMVRPEGPACHTGRISCFFNEVDVANGAEASKGGAPAGELSFDPNLLESIYKLIQGRRVAGETGGSYVARLFAKGEVRILEKVEEEAEEVARAIREETSERSVEEVADLWFHTLVALALKDVPPGAVLAELARRFGRGGRPESS